MGRRYFFLSYAHGERTDDKRVERFFTELCTEIRALTGDDQDAVVGFHDFRSLRVGATWPRELIEALRTARTFVALLSPRYFRSEFCGKEWTVFARRVDAYHAEAGRLAPSIIPVSWIHAPPPAALGDIHQWDPSFSDAYRTNGLRNLMRLEQEREAAAFVEKLAHRILEVAHENPLPETDERLDFHAVPSAFETSERSVPEASDPAAIPAPRLDPPSTPGDWPPTKRPILNLDTHDSSEQS